MADLLLTNLGRSKKENIILCVLTDGPEHLDYEQSLVMNVSSR